VSDHAAVPPTHVPVHRVVADVTERVIARSRETRTAYLSRISQAAAERGGRPTRADLGCSNLAHAVASCGGSDRVALAGDSAVSLGIVTAYNDMLSAHAPYETYPQQIKETARSIGGVARVAGGVPAMCDGITQGRAGMELSLFSRDVIAMSAAIALSHDAFDAALMLGVCDKIVPGLVAGALAFGHLPTALVPAGPMSSGLPNNEKAAVRRAHADGKVGREDLLAAEVASYHSPGTCTFYGTANSNQLLMDVMGLHLPGAAFVHPDSPLRTALTDAAARRVAEIASGDDVYGIGDIVDERVVVNGVVALLATGGSTNHTMHLVTMAAAAGVQLTWEDFDDLSRVVPLLARMYPNGPADVNHFHAAGGTPFLVGTLIDAGLLHEDVLTLAGPGLARYRRMPAIDEAGALVWQDLPPTTGNPDVLRPVAEAFEPDGGLRMLSGTLGNAVIKVSSVAAEHRLIEAPARVFTDQVGFLTAFSRRELDRDVVVVIRDQGPSANGMPELHALTPSLGVLQKRGHQVALLTDGRMSGASGSIPAAIHVTPESVHGGPIARLRDGDVVRLDADAGTLDVLVDPVEWEGRSAAAPSHQDAFGTGRELFASFRNAVGRADQGAHVFGPATPALTHLQETR
jgi:phosphogluconate dehydratase